MIVEYKMHVNKQGNLIAPFFIADGGHFLDGNKRVGIPVSAGSYIPSTLVELNRAALITRLTNIGYTEWDSENYVEVALNAEEIEAAVDTWIRIHDV